MIFAEFCHKIFFNYSKFSLVLFLWCIYYLVIRAMKQKACNIEVYLLGWFGSLHYSHKLHVFGQSFAIFLLTSSAILISSALTILYWHQPGFKKHPGWLSSHDAGGIVGPSSGSHLLHVFIQKMFIVIWVSSLMKPMALVSLRLHQSMLGRQYSGG